MTKEKKDKREKKEKKEQREIKARRVAMARRVKRETPEPKGLPVIKELLETKDQLVLREIKDRKVKRESKVLNGNQHRVHRLILEPM